MEWLAPVISIVCGMLCCTAMVCSDLKGIRRQLNGQTELLRQSSAIAEGRKSRDRFDDALLEAVADELERSLLRPPSKKENEPTTCSFVPVEVLRANTASNGSNGGGDTGR